MKILKFGGSSVADSEKILNVVKIAKQKMLETKTAIVVVSALSGTTDELINLANTAKSGKDYSVSLNNLKDRHILCLKEISLYNLNSNSNLKDTENIVASLFNDLSQKLNGIKLLKEVSSKTLDTIVSFGEILSSNIITFAFNISKSDNSENTSATFIDARNLIITDQSYGNAKVNFEITEKNINKFFENKFGIYVVTGFIASSEDGETTTLGRGGSDYTASIIGSALNVSEIEIWTDVSGLYTADPSIVKKAFPQNHVSYAEAMELSHFGAKVIYPPTILPALNKDIPIIIKNTYQPEAQGTIISKQINKERKTICGISSIKSISFLRLEGGGMVGIAGISKRLFSALADKKINVILITQASSEHTICFAVRPEEAIIAKKAVDEEFQLEINAKLIKPLIVEDNKNIVSIVGENMKSSVGIAGQMFSSLGKNGINISAIAQGSSELSISAVIDKENEQKALRALHEEFFFPETKAINVYLVGTGLIGKALLNQIKEHSKTLESKSGHFIRVVGIANSKNIYLDPEGLDLNSFSLNNQGNMTSSIDEYIKIIKEQNLPNSVFVDCTASEEVVKKYQKILDSSISIITPNKKAQTGSYNDYIKLKNTANKKRLGFVFETSVGAGLPVINTLNDLLKSGDKIISIEAVLSGTLSFIFNSFDGSKSFSDVVLEAKENGFTEPDPRDDLNGLDVARKILILAREAGYNLELDQVEVENLVPESARITKDVNEFFSILKNSDNYFQELLEKAKKSNSKLCYIASLENEKAQVKLKIIDQNHPFYNLQGSDNIISYKTNRYLNRPLVVKGPGAGAEVTAAGVFADIVRLAN